MKIEGKIYEGRELKLLLFKAELYGYWFKVQKLRAKIVSKVCDFFINHLDRFIDKYER